MFSFYLTCCHKYCIWIEKTSDILHTKTKPQNFSYITASPSNGYNCWYDFTLGFQISTSVARLRVGLQFLRRLWKILPGGCGAKACCDAAKCCLKSGQQPRQCRHMDVSHIFCHNKSQVPSMLLGLSVDGAFLLWFESRICRLKISVSV